MTKTTHTTKHNETKNLAKAPFGMPSSQEMDHDDDDDEIAYFTVRWKTRASFVYRTKNMR